MMFKVAVFLGLILVVQAEYTPSPKAKDCLTKVGVDEEAIRHIVTTNDVIAEDDEKMEKFLTCFYGEHISDANELVVDDKLKTHTVNVLTNILGANHEGTEELAREILEQCKDQKGDSKGITCIRVVNCLRTKLAEHRKSHN